MKKFFSFAKKEYKKISAFVFVFAFIFGGVLLLNLSNTQAGSNHKFSGWGWSENIGWISFNCTNEGCGSSNYGVDYTQTAPNVFDVTGYAWSENIGWIKFDAGFPVGMGGGTTASSAKLTLSGTTATLTGWARACSGTVNGDCTGATRTDGWDGWISLNGTNYGISFNALGGSANANSYAWGSDVVGWISFRDVIIADLVNLIPGSIDSFTAPACIRTNTQANIAWKTTGMQQCEILRDGVSVFTVPSVSLADGNKDLDVNAPSSEFYMHCVGVNGTSYNFTPSRKVKELNTCIETPADKKPGYKEI